MFLLLEAAIEAHCNHVELMFGSKAGVFIATSDLLFCVSSDFYVIDVRHFCAERG